MTTQEKRRQRHVRGLNADQRRLEAMSILALSRAPLTWSERRFVAVLLLTAKRAAYHLSLTPRERTKADLLTTKYAKHAK
jgi:hypothetical protein